MFSLIQLLFHTGIEASSPIFHMLPTFKMNLELQNESGITNASPNKTRVVTKR
jgi:hypothetical protein